MSFSGSAVMHRLSQARLHEYAVVFVLLALALYLSLTTENFLTYLNLSNVLQQVSTIGIIAVGMTVLLVTGNFDLSIGGIAALVGVSGVAAINTFGLVPGLAIGLGIGILLGAINGIAVVWLHVNSLVATLGSGLAFTGIAYVTTGSAPVPADDDGLQRIMTANVLTVPVPVLIFAAMVATFAYLLHFSVFGRQCYAVGANAEAARFAGIRVPLVQFVPFVLVGFLAGLAGIVLAGLLNSGQPSAAQSWPLGVIAAVVIGGVSISGGRGTVFQAVVGVLLIGLIDNGFNLLDFDPNYRSIFTGTIIVAAVALDSALRRRAQRRTRVSAPAETRRDRDGPSPKEVPADDG
jgi:ribose/xylose/arabinose/galactoside ABC-type transport system permease subunit